MSAPFHLDFYYRAWRYRVRVDLADRAGNTVTVNRRLVVR